MKIVFMGTPEFAIPSLKALVEENYHIAAVVTQPDKPKGRGNKLTPPPVKVFAEEKGIMVIQPEKIRTGEFYNALKALEPDLFVTVAYGRILPKDILDLPPLGCINVHGSLLPKYRGAAPIQWSVINGETKAGITTMYTDVGMDTGDMLLKREVEIPVDMTAGELHDVLSVVGADVLKETLLQLKEGALKREKQVEEDSTNAPIIKKEIGEINWNKSARDIHNLVRGANPWPGAFTVFNGGKLRIWKTCVLDSENHKLKPGTILKSDKSGMVAACGEGLIKIMEIQPESGRRMTVEEYLCGHKINEGEVIG
ncbi:MAG: methionyl-tRNA formyltransferase [Bacillota bacterium]|nr:methionyl-tRNA formyltransferase [Bacillota bacterium]